MHLELYVSELFHSTVALFDICRDSAISEVRTPAQRKHRPQLFYVCNGGVHGAGEPAACLFLQYK